jgi:hypothetical protein
MHLDPKQAKLILKVLYFYVLTHIVYVIEDVLHVSFLSAIERPRGLHTHFSLQHCHITLEALKSHEAFNK